MSERACVTFYSRTGNTHAVAKDIAARCRDPEVCRIRPQTERSYANWLLRSFLPGSRVPIRPLRTDLREFDTVFLGTPKWTFSCPPVTEFVSRGKLDGVTVAPFVTYGGFDEERYTRRLAARLRRKGAAVPATLRVARDSIGGPEYESAIDEFYDRVVTVE